MSEIKVNKISPRSGTNITLGDSGDNFIILSGATMPSKAEVEAKIAEIKQTEIDKQNAKASAQTKLQALGLTTEEIKALIGI